MLTERLEEEAELKRLEGNSFYQSKNYKMAVSSYTEALDCHEIPAYYTNRAAAYQMMGMYESAADDCVRAITLLECAENSDVPMLVKANLRAGKNYMMMAKFQDALRHLNKARELDPSVTVIDDEIKKANSAMDLYEEIRGAIDKKHYSSALDYLMRCSVTIFSTTSRDNWPLALKLYFMELQILQKQNIIDVEVELNAILRDNPQNFQVIRLKGLIYYISGDTKKAAEVFSRCLRLNPDHGEIKSLYKRTKQMESSKDLGNKYFKEGKNEEAIQEYTKALQIDSDNSAYNSKLYSNRATAFAKLEKYTESIEDCTKCIEIDSNYYKAYLRRADGYMKLKQYQEAVYDYESIMRLDPEVLQQNNHNQQEIKRTLRSAQHLMELSKRKDYYQILGVTKQATEYEIKKAYKQKALLYHPDKNNNKENVVDIEAKFKEVSEAYSILVDPEKRRRHDLGQDVSGTGGVGGMNSNFHSDEDIINMFFGGGGGGAGAGGFGGMGGNHHFPFGAGGRGGRGGGGGMYSGFGSEDYF